MKFVAAKTVLDPDTHQPVDVDVFKLETGEFVGFDRTSLENLRGTIWSPYKLGVELVEK